MSEATLSRHGLQAPHRFILSLSALFITMALAMIIGTPAHAANTLVSTVYQDANTDGTVDRIRLTFDENVTACAYEAGDWTVNTAGTITAVITGISCTGADAILDVAITADANETGGADAPVISYTQATGTANSVTLTSGNMTDKANMTATDGAGPVSLSATYLDTNTNGVVDRIDVVMSTDVGLACTFEAGDWTFPTPGSINITAATACAISGSTIQLTVAGDANETGGAVNPTVTYTEQGVANQAVDGANNDVVIAARAATDAASPVSLSATYLDVNGNGTVDRIDVVMSTDTGLACTFEAGDWTFPAAGTINITGATACAISGSTIQLTVAGTAATTGGAVDPTVTYTEQGVANQAVDGANNDVIIAARTVTDAAGPASISATYLDTNTNGVVDRIDIVMSADVGLACTFEADDWTFPAPGTITISAATACAISGSTIRLTVTGGANKTGGAVNPTVTYTEQGVANQAVDGANNDVVIAARAALDAAAPLAITTSPANAATEVDSNASIIVTFTEPMTTAGFSLGFAPTVSTVSYAWSNGNATLTAGHANSFQIATTYTATLAGTDASAALNALSAGIAPIVFTFTGRATSGGNSGSTTTTTPDDTPTTPTPSTPPTPTTPTTPAPTPTPAPEPTPEPAPTPHTSTTFGKSLTGITLRMGSLVKNTKTSAVYYIDATGVRHVFTTSQIYQSWYGNDFSTVVELSDATLAALRLGRPVTMRPGKMIKITSDPKVYLVVEGRGLRHISSEAIANSLFGANWNKMIVDEEVTAFSSYNMMDPISGSDEINLDTLEGSDITISSEV